MKPIQRVAYSLLLTVFLFSGFAFLSYTRLFTIIQSGFYSESVLRRIGDDLNAVGTALDEYHEAAYSRFGEILKNQAIRNLFDLNRSSDDILSVEGIFQNLSVVPGFIGFRLVDAGESLHFSTFGEDSRESENRIVYNNYSIIDGQPPFDEIALSGSNKPFFTYWQRVGTSDLGSIIYSLAAYDERGVQRGTALFYLSPKSIESHLLKANILSITDRVLVLGRRGIVIVPKSFDFDRLGLRDQIIEVLSRTVGDFSESMLRGPVTVLEGTEGSEDLELIHVTFPETGFIGTVVPASSFELNEFLRILLLSAFFVTTFLVIFLIFSLRQDRMVVLSDRIKRLQIHLLREYVGLKDDVRWGRWEKDLQARKEYYKAEIRKGIDSMGDDTPVDELIDKGWEEILGIISRRVAREPVARIDTADIEQIFKKVISEQLAGSNIVIPRVSVPAPAEVVEEAEELVESVEVLEETEELAESFEEIEEAEEAEGFDELVEELAETADLAEVVEEAEELVESVEELDELFEELEEAEEAEEIEEAEELEVAEELEGFEELVEELGETADLAEVVEVESGLPIDTDYEKSEDEQGEYLDTRGIDILDSDLPEIEFEIDDVDVVGASAELKALDEIEDQAVSEAENVELEEVEALGIDIGEPLNFDDILTESKIIEVPILDDLEAFGGDADGEPAPASTVHEDIYDLDLESISPPEPKRAADIHLEIALDDFADGDATESEPATDSEEFDETEWIEEAEELERSEAAAVLSEDVYEVVEELKPITQERARFSLYSSLYEPAADLFARARASAFDSDAMLEDIVEKDDSAAFPDNGSRYGEPEPSDTRILDAVSDGRLIVRSIGEILMSLEDTGDTIEVKEGVFSISERAFSAKSTHEDPGLKDLVDSIIEKEVEESLSINDFLPFHEVDLTIPLEMAQSSSIPKKPDEEDLSSSRLFDEEGLNYDYLLRMYRGNMGIVKSLMRISHVSNSPFAAILTYTSDSLVIEHSVGLSQVSKKSLVLPFDDVFVRELLSYRMFAALTKLDVQTCLLDRLLDNQDLRPVSTLLYIPIVFNNDPAYLLLGMRTTIESIENIVQNLNNIDL